MNNVVLRLLILATSAMILSADAHAQVEQDSPLISRRALLDDSRQIRDLLESIHPQPYLKGGGKMAFHRRFQEILSAIPGEGMTREDFRELLTSLVASVGDGHTYIYADGPFDFAGVPFLFYVVEQDLYVSAVLKSEHREYLGARLRAVEGVEIGELARRMRVYYGADNIYGTLVQLANFELFLAKKVVLEDLVPEWQDMSVVNVSLLMPDSSLREVSLKAGSQIDPEFIRPKPGIELPSLGGLEFGWGFLDGEQDTAYLRVLRMERNRETYEKRASYSDVTEEVLDFYGRVYGDEVSVDFEEAMSALPSLTETYSDLFTQMKNAGTSSLIIDLRTNVGGWALAADILVYFLYGKEALIDVHRRTNVVARKLSPEYFADDPEQTLFEMNSLAATQGIRAFDLTDSDYDFSEPEMLEDGLLNKDYARKLLEDDLALSPTFFSEYQADNYSNYYSPDNIIVVTDSATFSAGFMFAQYLKLLGATVVGSVPSQNIGQMGEVVHYELDNTKLGGAISRSFLIHDSSISGSEVAESMLMPDYELTYEKLKELGFSRPAAIEYALEILDSDQ